MIRHLCMCVVLGGMSLVQAAEAPASWVAAWSAPSDYAAPALPAMTIRQTLRVSAGGSAVRLRLSNLFGDKPLVVGPVRVEGAAGPVTFAGAGAVTIAPQAQVVSDVLALPVRPLQQLTVSLYLPRGADAATVHATGIATVQLQPGPDATAAPRLASAQTDDSRYFLNEIDVLAGGTAGTLVVVGDSISDGVGSTLDANHRWPDLLAERLSAQRVAVANAGTAGNRILSSFGEGYIGPSTVSRFDRDVLSLPNVRWVVFLQGINDITGTFYGTKPEDKVTVQQMTGAIGALAARTHAHGARFWAGTLLPRAGALGPHPHTPEIERMRQAVNAWIRASKLVDGVLDFDAALRDPAHPDALLPAYASKDRVHPNDAGYRRMAETVDLARLLAAPKPVTGAAP